MAYYFDEMGQYVEYETEEERKRRENFNNTAVQTQEIKTYGDGTVEKITKEEMPGDYAPAIQPVATQPVQRMPVQQPVAPVAPDMSSYNANIARQESGNQPGIGFHNQAKSSAYGTYGLTNAAYTDARKLNPDLPADIRQATPEQQTAAQNSFTQQNAGYLQNLGIDPTPNNLAAAHFLGAQGLSNYLKDGSVSEAAARANGGADNVRRIVQQRLGGQAAPASAAAQAAPAQAAPAAVSPYSLATGQSGMGIQTGTAPVTEPARQYIDSYQSIQDDPMRLMALRSDESAPKFIRERAGEQAYNLMDREVKTAEATKQAQQLAQAASSGDRKASNTIARELQGQEGSYLKMILLGFISPTLAGEEAVKLGYGNKWTTTTDADGKAALIQVNAKGLPLKGYAQDGTEIASDDLVKYVGGGAAAKNLDIVGGTFVNDKTGEVGRMVTDKRTGKTQVQTDSGLKSMTGFRPQSSTGTLEDQRTRTIQDINLRLRGKGVEESMAILRDYNQRLVGQGFAAVQPGEVGINVPQIGGGTAAAPAQGQSAAQAAVAGSGGKITPLPTTQAAPGAVQPTALPAGGVPPASTLPAGTRPTMSQLDAQATIAKETAEAVGKDIGVTAANFGKAKDSAMTLINQAQSLVDDPGFSVSVGATVQPGFQFIPGTDKATWMAKKEEVVGKTFLTAIESLKGFGALSDQEGRAATAAISRLNNTDQNEDSYKAAVKELQDIVKRGVDRNAAKLGKPTVFGTEEFTEKSAAAAAMSPADKARAEMERRRKEKK